MNKSLGVALGIVGTIAVIILILATGGSPTGTNEDARDDVAIGEGASPPQDTTLADIVGAEVRREDGSIVFVATMGDDIPKKVPNGSVEFRWDVSEDGDDTWIVSANLNLGPTAAVTSQKTSYGSSTIDGSMPGSIEIDGDKLIVTVKADKIDGFPTDFAWILKTTLDADRADPASAVATDTAPDSGPGKVQ